MTKPSSLFDVSVHESWIVFRPTLSTLNPVGADGGGGGAATTLNV
jgi:hypothetical protein